MNAVEWWDNVRQCATDLQQAQKKLYMLERFGKPQSQNETRTCGAISDPTSSTAIEICTSQIELEALAGYCAHVLNDAQTACERIGAILGIQSREVMRMYYIKSYNNAQTAKAVGLSVDYSRHLRYDSIKLCDEIGMPHMIKGWDYK